MTAYVNSCCAEPANRKQGLGPRGTMGGFRAEPGATYCVVCLCRHIEVVADLGKLGLVGTAL